jgi:hypothetical protein
VSVDGVSTDPKTVFIIQQWPISTYVKELRSFLWMGGYHRKFVAQFGIISRPLTNLLKRVPSLCGLKQLIRHFLL